MSLAGPALPEDMLCPESQEWAYWRYVQWFGQAGRMSCGSGRQGHVQWVGGGAGRGARDYSRAERVPRRGGGGGTSFAATTRASGISTSDWRVRMVHAPSVTESR